MSGESWPPRFDDEGGALDPSSYVAFDEGRASTRSSAGGERDGDREVIENNTRDIIESGVAPDKARQMAVDSMRRVDGKMRREGKR